MKGDLFLQKVRENDTRKTSNVAFQTLRFEKVRENETRKTSNVTFQMLYFIRCGLKKYGKMKCFMTSCTQKISNVAFQTLRFEKVQENDTRKT